VLADPQDARAQLLGRERLVELDHTEPMQPFVGLPDPFEVAKTIMRIETCALLRRCSWDPGMLAVSARPGRYR
jgi:hypothetical protein